MADLSKLIVDHRAAMAEYEGCDDDHWDACKDAINAKLDASTRALLDHRPASPSEARSKAEFMAADKAFAEWDNVDFAAVLRSLIPVETTDDASPIMTVFATWNALRDRGDEPGIGDDEVSRCCDETDQVMSQLLSLPPTDAADLAAKLMCFTHYGNYALDECAGGDGLMQEMAAMVGQMDRLADKFQPAHGGSPCA